MAEAAGVEEIEPGPAPERAELASADGGGRRAVTDGGGESRPTGHVHPRRQLRAALAREGRCQVRRCRWGRLEAPCRRQPRDGSADARLVRGARQAGDALDPPRGEEPAPPGGAARQLDEARWPGTGSPARMFPKPTTYARARPRMPCAPTVSTSRRRAASESRSLWIVSLVTTYPTTLNSTMSRGSASPNEPAERSRECFKARYIMPHRLSHGKRSTGCVEAEQVGLELQAGCGLREA